jgi:hypothetical protein
MTAFNLLNILVLSSLAIFASFGPSSVNAVSIESPYVHLARHAHHDAIAALHKRTNNNSRRCKPRPSPSAAAAPTSTQAKPSSSPAPAPSPAPPSSNSGGLPKIGIATDNTDINILKAFKTDKVGWYVVTTDFFSQL